MGGKREFLNRAGLRRSFVVRGPPGGIGAKLRQRASRT